MISIDLRDPHLSENLKAIKKFKRGILKGLFSDEEIQKMYDEQVKADLQCDNAEHCVCCGAVIPEGRQTCPNCEAKNTP